MPTKIETTKRGGLATHEWQDTFGIEIECIRPASLSYADVVDGLRAAGIEAARGFGGAARAWKVVTDGSTGANGAEVVSPILEGPDGLAEVKSVMTALLEMGCTVNRNCGMHVHFGARDLNLKQMKNIAKLWVKFEDSIDLLLAPSRRDNQYCRSNVNRGIWSDTQTTRVNRAMDRIAAADNVTGIGSAMGRGRYVKLNYQAFWRHGTIEVRAHGGSLDGEKATMWIRLMGGLLAAGATLARVQGRKQNDAQDARFRVWWFLRVAARGDLRRYWSKRFRNLDKRAGGTGRMGVRWNGTRNSTPAQASR